MRKVFPLLTVIAAMALAIASCSRSVGTSPTGLDRWRDTADAAGPNATADTLTGGMRSAPLTSQGFGAIRLGTNIEMLPTELAGVYDSLALTSEFDYEQPYRMATAFLRGTQTMEILAIEDSAIVDAITILTPAITVAIDSVRVGVGTKAAQAKRLGGVTHVPKTAMEGERLEYRDIRFYIDGDSIYAVAVGSNI
ncbi:MAG: hypothetical protein HUK14_00080 [Muribaculaceae bacterium]|nr:hypothetical protein [Muribaculaceae bacterium]